MFMTIALTDRNYQRFTDALCEIGYERPYPRDIQMFARELLKRFNKIARSSGRLVIFPADTELLMLTSFVWDSYLPRHSERKWVRDIGDFLTDCIEAVPACELNAYYEKLTKLAKAKECSQ